MGNCNGKKWSKRIGGSSLHADESEAAGDQAQQVLKNGAENCLANDEAHKQYSPFNDNNKDNNSHLVIDQLRVLKQELQNEFRAELNAMKIESAEKISTLKKELARERTDKLLLQYKLETMEQNCEKLIDEMQMQQMGKLEAIEVRLETKIAAIEEKVSEEDWQKESLEKQIWEMATQNHAKWKELGMKLNSLEMSLYETLSGMQKLGRNLFTLRWFTNGWHIYSGQEPVVRTSADGLNITNTNNDWISVRAQQPISRALFITFPGLQMVYYEVTVKKKFVTHIGWAGPNFLLFSDRMIGPQKGSYAIDWCGDYWESGREVEEGYGMGFSKGDVIGSGFTREGRLFFTLNGALNGKPVTLAHKDLILFPAVNLHSKGSSVEANFGADPAKPFKFDINAHGAELF